ncbi:hypothetical protein DSECCO2_523130 [anaerobic digester metagenome]
MEMAHAGFYNHACSADLRPLHRNTQPGIARSPAARANQQIISFFHHQCFVQLLYDLCQLHCFSCIEFFRNNIHHIADIVVNTVAKRRFGYHDAFVTDYLLRDDGQVFPVVYNRPYLQQIKHFVMPAPVHVDGKLNLNRLAHFKRAGFKNVPHHFCKRKNIMLQKIIESDNSHTLLTYAIHNPVIVIIVG